MIGIIPKKNAVDLAEQILQMNPSFFALSGRHTNISGVHAELWSGWKFNLRLASTGVTSGADAWATDQSPAPLISGDTIQIKARGQNTMHITYSPRYVKWLLVAAYDLKTSPVKPNVYLFKTDALEKLAHSFRNEFGKDVLPVRIIENKLRLEWSCMFTEKMGRVKGYKGNDTWDLRNLRAKRVLAEMYKWDGNEFLKGSLSR